MYPVSFCSLFFHSFNYLEPGHAFFLRILFTFVRVSLFCLQLCQWRFLSPYPLDSISTSLPSVHPRKVLRNILYWAIICATFCNQSTCLLKLPLSHSYLLCLILIFFWYTIPHGSHLPYLHTVSAHNFPILPKMMLKDQSQTRSLCEL
jgi:hypothetical protein